MSIRENPLQDWFSSLTPRTASIVTGAFVAVTAAILGILLAVIGPIYTTALLIALIGGLWMFASLEFAIWSVAAIIALLPFATLPFKVVITPTFLDIAFAAVFFHYITQWMTGERRRLATTPVHIAVVIFMILSIFSFAAGLRYSSLNITVMRKFAELVMSMLLALVLVDVIRTNAMLKRLTGIIIAVGTLAAILGVVLWLMPDGTAESLLRQLSIIGYPDAGIIQYIEQNPELNERAISTSVNPNSLGGLLVMIGALVAPQLITEHPVTGKRWHAVIPLGAIVLCLILTFSRGSMMALGVAFLFIAAIRYRRLLLLLPVVALLVLVLPWSQAYVERFAEGLQFADLATQMRLGEYQDALTLITRYPLLGVGFIGTPDIDIYLGVASVYFTIAENMGLLGLTAFIVLMGWTFGYAWQARPYLDHHPGLRAIWLGLLAGLIGALANGFLDHYFFNLEFHHAITIFWIYVGLTLAATRIALEDRERQSALEQIKTIAVQ